MSVSLDGSWTAGACAIELPATKKQVKRNEGNMDRWYFIVSSLIIICRLSPNTGIIEQGHLIRADLRMSKQYLNVRNGLRLQPDPAVGITNSWQAAQRFVPAIQAQTVVLPDSPVDKLPYRSISGLDALSTALLRSMDLTRCCSFSNYNTEPECLLEILSACLMFRAGDIAATRWHPPKCIRANKFPLSAVRKW